MNHSVLNQLLTIESLTFLRSDTMYIHGNNITGTFPDALCKSAASLVGLVFWAIDCSMISCTDSCCEIDNCYVLKQTADQ